MMDMGHTMSQPLSGGDIKKTQSTRRLFDHVFHTVRGLFDDYIPLSFNLL
jgi:hypothetical protein